MRILMISTDEKILEDDSPVRDRMRLYSRAAGELHIVVISKKRMFNMRDSEAMLWLSSTHTKIKSLSWFDAVRYVRRVMKEHGEEGFLLTTQDEMTGIAGYIASKVLRIPWQAQIHSDPMSIYFKKHTSENEIRAFVVRRFFKRASCIRTVSKRAKNSLRVIKKFSKKQIDVLPIYIDLEKYLNIARINLSRPRLFDFKILMSTRLTTEKNVGLAIESIAQVVSSKPQTSLLIVGDGPEKERLEKKVADMELGSHVSFEGWKDNIIPYLKAADIFLMTSWYEGCGVSVIEAMASGVPVVMTDVGIAGEIVRNGETGIVAPVNSKSEIVEGLLAIINNEELADRLRVNAIKEIKNLPHGEDYLIRMKEIWMSCAEKKK